MKEEINKEMDVLLRRLSRRDGTTGPNGENSSASNHLDVDELNAYSENALPEKTRLRYTEHLAECAQCRRIVAQLTQSAAVDLPKGEKPKASWLASILGKFLSPFTWR
ncbi:MAG TPA: zf-HC2 domain-containing protein, partial [Pyrinomonadaceae bacterium]|nr:zf-HC2 domain-containing protein [Pyrinomonadaceae bacterium]